MQNQEAKQEIYFHVGMGKVASKYLQYKIFPKLQGITYIPTTRYFQAKDIIRKAPAGRYLLSREFDQQMEREVSNFAKDFPDTRAIIFFRRHDSWIASQYRRFAKNGYVRTFSEFLDLENDTGRFQKKDLDFYRNIEILTQYFSRKPLVLFYDELLSSPESIIQKITAYTKTSCNVTHMSKRRKHTSYSEKQIKVMQAVSRIIRFREKRKNKTSICSYVLRLPVLALRYIILFTAYLVPDALLPKSPLIPAETLENIKNMTAADWQKCLDFAKNNNPA